MKSKFSLDVNGATHTVEVDPKMPLIYVLRNYLQLNGPKYGCGEENCGACLVLVDNIAAPTCKMPVESVVGRTITTIEGLANGDNELHPVQRAFVEEQAAQCGYCLNGMIISTVSLLRHQQIRKSEIVSAILHRNLCRCGTHTRILKAIGRVANLEDPK